MRAVRSFAPGRTELAGNHTDHQGGRVIAAAVDRGVTMHIRPAEGGRAQVTSPGFDFVDIDVADNEPHGDEAQSTAALVRGVIAGLRARDIDVGAFEASVESTVPVGGGLSSSAAFELALAAGLDLLYGEGALDPVQLAHIGVEAERNWFGKPCGFMDQLACAIGGTNLFDFGESGESNGQTLECGVAASNGVPRIEPIPFDLDAYGYSLCLVDTCCDHSLYTDDYAQVAEDMTKVAEFFGATMLSQVDEGTFMSALPELRAGLGDLRALRGLHYYHEMHLVDTRAQTLRASDFEAFLAATRASGASSAQFLQNVSAYGADQQPAMFALAVVEHALKGQGAARIHGGGFGGSIQAFVPTSALGSFVERVEGVLGDGTCGVCRVVAEGSWAQWA